MLAFHDVETLEHASGYFRVVLFVEMHDLMVFIFPAIKTSLESVAMDDAHVAGMCPESCFFVFGKAVSARIKIEPLLSFFHDEGEQSIVLFVGLCFAAKQETIEPTW